MKATRTWILVADGGKARILENLGPGHGIHQVPNMDETLILPPNRDLLSDRPGRGFESASPTRHAYETADPHRDMKRQFAHHLLLKLKEFHGRGAFDRLVIVAPPAMLGDLRAAIGPELSKVVVGELAQDLVHLPTGEIEKHIGKLIAV